MKLKPDYTIREQNPLLTNGVFPPNLPYTLTIDRLELMFNPVNDLVPLQSFLTHLPMKEGFICASEDISMKGTTQEIEGFSRYKKIYYIYYKKEKIAVLGTDFFQRKKGLENDFTKLKFENQIFYIKNEGFWHEAFISITEALPVQLRCIHYLEIALDANRCFRDHLGHLYNYSKKNMHCLLKHQVYQSISKASFATSHNGKTLFIGKKEDKQVAVYDKLEEIKDQGKDYILSYFQANGLDTENSIHRIEVRLKKNIRDYDLPLINLTKVDYLFSLFKKELHENLKFKDLSQYEYRNRTKVFEILDVLPFEELISPQQIELKKKLPEQKQETFSNNVAPSFVKQLVHQYLLEGDNTYLATISDVVDNKRINGAYGYIERFIDEFCPEYIIEDFFCQRISNLLSCGSNMNNMINNYRQAEKFAKNEKPKNMDIQLLISINQELKRNLEQLIKTKKTNKSKLIRELVQEAFLRELQNS